MKAEKGTFRLSRRLAAFTLTELLVAIGIIALLIAILIPVISKANQAAKSTSCVANLRSITNAFRIYANANRMYLPDPANEQLSWEQMISPYYQGGSFQCPSDDELFPSVGSSYDWRDTGDANTTMA